MSSTWKCSASALLIACSVRLHSAGSNCGSRLLRKIVCQAPSASWAPLVAVLRQSSPEDARTALARACICSISSSERNPGKRTTGVSCAASGALSLGQLRRSKSDEGSTGEAETTRPGNSPRAVVNALSAAAALQELQRHVVTNARIGRTSTGSPPRSPLPLITNPPLWSERSWQTRGSTRPWFLMTVSTRRWEVARHRGPRPASARRQVAILDQFATCWRDSTEPAVGPGVVPGHPRASRHARSAARVRRCSKGVHIR